MTRPGIVLRTLAACVLATLPGGCVPREEPAPSVPRVALPDVSRLAAPVQAQIREWHAVLMARLENQATPRSELAQAYGDLGLILMAAEYYQTAASCYLSAQALAPDDVRWPYYLGHLYRIQGETPKAGASFAQALKLQPADMPTLIWLGEMRLDQNRPDLAQPLFVQALSKDPGSAAALSGAGRAALAAHDLPRAVEYLERALTVDPAARGLHHSLAAAYRGLGQLDRAATHLARRGSGRPVPRDPLMEAYETVLHSPLTYETQGLRAMEDGKAREAADLFRKGLALAPDDPALLHRLGTALFMAGDTAGAVHQFEQALRRSPEFARAHFGLGMVFSLTHRPADAIARFEIAVKYQPDYLEARLGLAEALRVTGRLQESLPHFKRIVELDPGLADAWAMYAMTLVRLQRYREARDVLDEAQRVHPDAAQLTELLSRLPP